MATRDNSPMQQLREQLATHRRSVSGLLLICLLGLAGSWGTRWLSDPQRFPLDVVEVKGEFRYLQNADVQTVLSPHVTGGFFTVDVDSIRAAAEELPWVRLAKVRRIWPATLRVQITEQQAVAGWNEGGFLNAAGDAFFPSAGPAPSGLPQLAGPEGQAPRVLQQYREVERTLQALGLQVDEVTMDGRRAWSLRMDGGIELKLGRAQPWQRLQRFVRAWPDVFAGRTDDLKRVDMRYSNGFSVYWQRQDAGEVLAQRDT